MQNKTTRGLMLSMIVLLTAVAMPRVGNAAMSPQDDQSVIPLEKITANPTPFVDQDVAFVVQFHSVGGLDAPFYTEFERDWHMNFSAWPDGAPLWRKETYLNVFRHLFIERHKKTTADIIHAPKFSRWVVVGKVKSTFNGKPWILVTGLSRLEHQIQEAQLIKLHTGFRHRNAGRFAEAAVAFRAADGPNLPVSTRTIAIRNECFALNEAGKSDEALSRLNVALAQLSDDPNAVNLLSACRDDVTESKNARLAKAKKAAASKTESTDGTAPVTTLTTSDPDFERPLPEKHELHGKLMSKPKDSRPEPTTPRVTQPETSHPEVTTPKVTKPEVTTPDVTKPEVKPEVTTPEVTTPEVTTPEVTTPEVTTPEVTTPEVTTPEVTTPKVEKPEVTTPKVTSPKVTEPKVSKPKTSEVEPSKPGTKTPGKKPIRKLSLFISPPDRIKPATKTPKSAPKTPSTETKPETSKPNSDSNSGLN